MLKLYNNLHFHSMTFLSTPVLNFTGDWAEASVKANATYKSFSNVVVSAEVGLHVGLYGINITLKGESSIFIVHFLRRL